jgi:hypothetical protein
MLAVLNDKNQPTLRRRSDDNRRSVLNSIHENTIATV